MIALGILTTWLTLTAAGFAGLSALRRADAREEADGANLAPSALAVPAFAEAGASIPKALLR
jgi:hypothetical protein